MLSALQQTASAPIARSPLRQGKFTMRLSRAPRPAAFALQYHFRRGSTALGFLLWLACREPPKLPPLQGAARNRVFSA
jgi:hypothetical protein